MKRRSPRVVAIGSQPFLRTVGERSSQTVMAASMSTMAQKNTATGKVHAIHSNISIAPSHAPHRESLGDVVAHEPDDYRAGNDGEHAGRREHAPVHPRGRDGARHDGDDRLGVD